MANRKLGKAGNLGKVIPSFISEFSILPYCQNRKLGLKNLGKKFPIFPSFRPGLNFHLKKGNRRENFRICCGIMYNRRKRYLKLVCHISNHLFKSKSQEITV